MSVLPVFSFSSRRSPVYAANGMAAASQPVAVEAGLSILRQGGSAADAAIAMSAVLAVVEPCSTGIGGDGFALTYEAKNQQVRALNGSGKSGSAHTLEAVFSLLGDDIDEIPKHHGMGVTVPGVCSMWAALHEEQGVLDFEQLLDPAIRIAEKGFLLAPVTAELWGEDADVLRMSPNGSVFLKGKETPAVGARMTNAPLAKCLRLLAQKGGREFYHEKLASRMVSAVRASGGVLSLEDFMKGAHAAQWDVPLNVAYRGVTVHECPPNGQGIVALQALGLLAQTDAEQFAALSTERLHRQIEALRLAFADAKRYVCDPEQSEYDPNLFLNDEYLKRRAARILTEKRNLAVLHGDPEYSCDTVQFCVVDGNGNAVSMVNSVYTNFGSGIIPDDCGFVMQNRGCNFSLVAAHPNCLAPAKRPYHTIIPCLTTRSDGSLHGVMGVMGGFMQPQGHVQILSALLDDNCNPQEALDRLRFCMNPDATVSIEEGFAEGVIEGLEAKQHSLVPTTGYDRKLFGRGQIILSGNDGSLCAGSDPRADGCAFGIW